MPRFVIQLAEPRTIEHARRILREEEWSCVHAQGTIIKEPAIYNPRWRCHSAPESIERFDHIIEVCDDALQCVEAHLDEVGGFTLPGAHWCPWSSQLVDEVDPERLGGL
jgi:hypothetical protein